MRTCSLKSTGEHSGPTEVRLHTRAVCLRHLLYFGSFLTESGCPRHVRFIPDGDCRADISVRQPRAMNGDKVGLNRIGDFSTKRQGFLRPCGRLIQSTVCSCGECSDLCPLPSTSSNKTKLPAGTRLSSPSLVWYSADPSSLTVRTRSGTVCQSTCRAPAGMCVKRMPDAAYFADTSNAAALG